MKVRESTHICIWVRKSDVFSSGFPSLQRCFRVGVDNIMIISISLCYVTIITTFISWLAEFKDIKLPTHN